MHWLTLAIMVLLAALSIAACFAVRHAGACSPTQPRRVLPFTGH